jgi:hypothetical protein
MLVTVILPPTARPDQLWLDRHPKSFKRLPVPSETPRRRVFLIGVDHGNATMPLFEEQFGSQKPAVDLIRHHAAGLAIACKAIHQHERKTEGIFRHLHGPVTWLRTRCRRSFAG